MRILNIGSMNLDMVYQLDHIVQPGETEASFGMNVFLGGKGINQSVAAAKAGAEVCHGGMIGEDGQPFLDACKEFGVDGSYIRKVPGKSGHAIIQIDRNAQNSILLFGGANQMLTEEYVDSVLADFAPGDILLLQNEVNMLPYIVDKAHERGLLIALNPSPFNAALEAVDLKKISLFLLNEVEGNQITGLNEPSAILEKMLTLFPGARIVLTLGKDGAVYADAEQKVFQPIFPVKAVDTTAAGDTFTGFFVAAIAAGADVHTALDQATKAAAISVGRKGAAPSIPTREEMLAF